MFDSVKDQKILAEITTLEKVFFSKAELEIKFVERDRAGYGPYARLYDHRRKVGNGDKSFKRQYYDAEELLRYLKKLCSAKSKINTPSEITDADRERYKALRKRLEIASETTHANVGYITITGKAGYTASGAQRRPWRAGCLTFEHYPIGRSFPTFDELEAFMEAYLDCCITKVQHAKLAKINQEFFEARVKGRINCMQSLGKSPVFQFATWGDGERVSPEFTFEEAVKYAKKILKDQSFRY